MKKKVLAILLSAATAALLLAGCGDAEESSNDASSVSEDAPESNETAEVSEDDQVAADEVAALIDAIYVQEWTEDTWEQCEAAKSAWDALTDVQKELVAGEEADPEYFGRDTGDAGLDDPLNQDDIGENELLVVSFGTSFNDSRATDIKGIEDALQEAYSDWSVRRAFTAQIIINHIYARDGEQIDNMEQALQRAVDNGVKNLVVQPTHLMHGAEYDELMEAVTEYIDQFDSVKVAEPLLGEVGSDEDSVNDDKRTVAEAIVASAVASSGKESLDDLAESGTALVLMGHGTSHSAKISYSQMQTQMDNLGYSNVFIGTVEGEPEETACENIIEAVYEAGYTDVILRPLMVVAGDHANNDMAGEDEDSWLSMFEASGYFDRVDPQIEGMGRIPEIEDLYIKHTAEAMAGESLSIVSVDSEYGELPDGVYTVDFDTDSSMFHVNEALDGKGTLTVENGEMTVHISLVSKSIVNLFCGLAEDAQEEGAELLEPTEDEVTYSDGTIEKVYGFDVPVPVLGEEFDVAIIGEKGVWYDHKVCVSNPVTGNSASMTDLDDGEYMIEVSMEGGSGKATISSPAVLTVDDGAVYARIEWSSPNYDYMVVDGETYLPVNDSENSVFEIPVSVFDDEMTVVADTTAMSEPHEITYTLLFDFSTIN